MAKRVDINSDMGEAFGLYTMGADIELLDYVTSANVACGFHAGDPLVMANTVREAASKGVAVGAHPGLPDLMGFGRRRMEISPEEAEAYVLYQVGALWAFAKRASLRLQHVKVHGALYHMAARDPDLALAIARGLARIDREMILLGLAGSHLLSAAQEMGLRTMSEVFADRSYCPNGTLVPRGSEESILHNTGEVISRAIRMVNEGKVAAIDGTDIDVKADSICIHGDTPGAVHLAASIRKALEASGICVKAMGQDL